VFFSNPDLLFALHGLLALTEAAIVQTAQQDQRPNYTALESAWVAVAEAGIETDQVQTLAVVDLTKPSYVNRMAIYKKGACRPEQFLCAHGKNTGDIYAQDFSNTPGSKQTSLGLYRVGTPYTGQWGVSLKLHGLEPGKNHNAYKRHIVLHSAWYSSEETIYLNIAEGYGPRIGRSLGCPAVPAQDLSRVCGHLRPGTLLYIHGKP